MLTLLTRKPFLSGLLYESLLHIIFWGTVVVGAQSSHPEVAYYSIFLFPLFAAQTLAFPFLHQKILTAGKGSRFALGTLTSGIDLYITEDLLNRFTNILSSLGMGGLIFLFAWFILLGAAVLKLLIALTQSLIYTRRCRRAPATIDEAPIN